jgi:hypothetical protein
LLLLTREQETGIVRNLVVAVLLLRQARRRGRPQEPRCSTSVGGDLRERRGRPLLDVRGRGSAGEERETEIPFLPERRGRWSGDCGDGASERLYGVFVRRVDDSLLYFLVAEIIIFCFGK